MDAAELGKYIANVGKVTGKSSRVAANTPEGIARAQRQLKSEPSPMAQQPPHQLGRKAPGRKD